ncbi:MAG TPA: SIS domain-containing protein [Pyrinomonadaceae bacterium]|nr:SIS domain-containing protein [Pyrinomonadaceae bacterium]
MQKEYSNLVELSLAERESLGLVHTLREILQQPQTWRQTYQRVIRSWRHIEDFLTRAGVGAARSRPLNVLLVGAGTSDYIGKSVCALLQKEWNCNVQAVPSTDLLTNMEDYVLTDSDYLWISFSRSGDSSEGVAVLEQALAKYPHIKHFIITCNQNGKMARFGERAGVFSFVLDDEVNDRGLAMTSSFSNMVVVAQALAHYQTLATYGSIVENLAACASTVLPAAMSLCERLVDEEFSRVCFLGTGPLKGAAIESGLKVIELTGGRVIGLTESYLGLRHGPLSAIDRDTLVVGFLSADHRRRAFELDLLREICDKKLTEKSLAVSPNGPDSFGETLDFGLTEDISDLYLPPLFVLAGQLLGLYASLREGLRPDEPSPHGAISRVVSHVTIH